MASPSTEGGARARLGPGCLRSRRRLRGRVAGKGRGRAQLGGVVALGLRVLEGDRGADSTGATAAARARSPIGPGAASTARRHSVAGVPSELTGLARYPLAAFAGFRGAKVARVKLDRGRDGNQREACSSAGPRTAAGAPAASRTATTSAARSSGVSSRATASAFSGGPGDTGHARFGNPARVRNLAEDLGSGRGSERGRHRGVTASSSHVARLREVARQSSGRQRPSCATRLATTSAADTTAPRGTAARAGLCASGPGRVSHRGITFFGADVQREGVELSRSTGGSGAGN